MISTRSVKTICLSLLAVTGLAFASFFYVNQVIAATQPAVQAETIAADTGVQSEAAHDLEVAGLADEALSEEAHGEDEHGGHGAFGVLFIFLAILIISAKIGGVIEKLGMPSVLGELLAGIVLSLIGFLGVTQIDAIRTNETIAFLAEVGAVILLFQIGLESNIKQLMKVGVSAFAVAILGVVVPFVLGSFVLGPWIFPNASFVAHLFLGASMVATSVGITASVFKNLNILKTRACQTVLGAAVIDDVLGLLVLAIVSAIATGGEVTPTFVATLSMQAFLFLSLAIVLGSLLAKPISTAFSKLHTGTGMKLAIAFCFALLYAYAATLVGLAPIVGAFAAGLVLDAVHFESFESPLILRKLKKINLRSKKDNELMDKLIHQVEHTHVEDMISSVSLIFVPLFFAYTGLQIEIGSLLNPSVYFYAVVASIIAILGKVVAGIAAKGDFKEKLLVGVSMVPRGEVGLIFASIGKQLGAIEGDEFSIIVLVVIITTFVSPPAIAHIGKMVAAEAKAAKAQAKAATT